MLRTLHLMAAATVVFIAFSLAACGGGGSPATVAAGSTAPTAPPTTPMVLKKSNGFTVSMWSYINHNDAVQSLNVLKSNTGANSVIIDFALQTPALSSNEIVIAKGSSIESFVDVINVASGLGLDVWIKPIVMVGDEGLNWQQLAPSDPQKWFGNYSTILNGLVDALPVEKISHFVITNELYSMTSNPAYSKNWNAMIAGLRSKYKGKIGFNAGGLLCPHVTCNEFANIPSETLSQIDFIGVSAYPRMIGAQKFSVEAVVSSWKSDYYGINIEAVIGNFLNAHPTLPMYFTELGSPAFFGGSASPSDIPDPESQRNFYIGSFNEISKNLKGVNGIFVYNWTLNMLDNISKPNGLGHAYAWDMYNKSDSYSLFFNGWPW